jgi:hypothetical protein
MLAGGWSAFARSNWIAAGLPVITAVMAWWIVAGVGLRIVRRFDHDGS